MPGVTVGKLIGMRIIPVNQGIVDWVAEEPVTLPPLFGMPVTVGRSAASWRCAARRRWEQVAGL